MCRRLRKVLSLSGIDAPALLTPGLPYEGAFALLRPVPFGDQARTSFVDSCCVVVVLRRGRLFVVAVFRPDAAGGLRRGGMGWSPEGWAGCRAGSRPRSGRSGSLGLQPGLRRAGGRPSRADSGSAIATLLPFIQRVF